MKYYLAFRKASDGWFGRLIRWRTNSIYSHVELVVGSYNYPINKKGSTCFSSSWMDGSVRYAQIQLKPENWDVFEVNDALSMVIDISMEELADEIGKPYDKIGVLTFGTPFASLEQKRKWFCSEIIGGALNASKPWKLSPQGIYEKYVKGFSFKKVS